MHTFFKRLLVAIIMLSIATPQVVEALPDAYKHPSFKNYITYDAKRHVYWERLLQMDGFCRMSHATDPKLHKLCWEPREVLPLQLIFVRGDLLTAQARTSSAPMRKRSANKLPCLREGSEVGVGPLLEPHDPAEFYCRWDPSDWKNQYGIRAWSSFTSRIVPTAHVTHASNGCVLRTFNLLDRVRDLEVVAELPAQYKFELSEACWIIASLISKQRNGETGDLLCDGHSNIFYVGSYAILAAWCGDNLGWGVGAWQAEGGNFWIFGDKVFVPKRSV